jgi:hypothetical protein
MRGNPLSAHWQLSLLVLYCFPDICGQFIRAQIALLHEVSMNLSGVSSLLPQRTTRFFLDRIPLTRFTAAAILLGLAVVTPAMRANATTFTVTLCTDANAGGAAGTGAGNAGDLRSAILAANAAGGANIINFSCGSTPATITLGGPLPPIFSNPYDSSYNLTIDGGQFGQIVIDGAGAYRIFFVDNTYRL